MWSATTSGLPRPSSARRSPRSPITIPTSCRGRNSIAGAKLSEHGKGNALDVRAIKLAQRRVVQADRSAGLEGRSASGCAPRPARRFTTVLGPGSDGYHKSHIHLDLAERSRGYRICQWDVLEPAPVAAEVPLPRPRPIDLAADADETR